MSEWTWAKERAAVILWLRDADMHDVADAIEQGDHLRALGELSVETSSPAEPRRRKSSARTGI